MEVYETKNLIRPEGRGVEYKKILYDIFRYTRTTITSSRC